LENSFVHNAVVKVSDGNTELILKEYALDTGLAFANRLYLYSIYTTHPLSSIYKFAAERAYKLTIDNEGKIYEAITKIPNVNPVDSVWFRKPSEEPEVETSMLLYVKFKDPDTPGNFFRYFTSRNQEIFLPGRNSVYED